MKKIFSFFRAVLTVSSFGSLSCWSSGQHLIEEAPPASLTRLPYHLQEHIFDTLAPKEVGYVASACKQLHQARKKHLMAPLRFERDFMLQDRPSRLEGFSFITLQKRFTLALEEDGFVFVPFGQNRPLENARSLSNHDITPYLSQLYEKAFGEKKELFTSQDVLCLKAVMPWSRVGIIKGNEATKQNALNALLTLEKNHTLARFSTSYVTKQSTQEPKTLVLTSVELDQNQDILHPFFKNHPDQHIHLVIEKDSCDQTGAYSLFGTSLPKVRYLTLSDPDAAAKSLGPNFLMCAEDLLSLDIKTCRAVGQIHGNFSIRCSALTSFNPRGLEVLTHLGHRFMSDVNALDEASRKIMQTFYQKVESRRINSLIQAGLFPEEFNVDRYWVLNPDIQQACALTEHPRLSAITHYLYSGKRDGRPYK
ncbi:MAG: hypothetical protein H2057_05900 [Alphaproteobacteria bacterium]|nr:hypothetical protein [Alphaproteobacteria bacterium]